MAMVPCALFRVDRCSPDPKGVLTWSRDWWPMTTLTSGAYGCIIHPVTGSPSGVAQGLASGPGLPGATLAFESVWKG